MPQRWCLDCGTLYDRDDAPGQRCPPCQARADQRRRGQRAAAARQRPSTAARGYGAEYQRHRNQLVAQALAAARAGNPLPCHLCGQPCLDGQQLSAEHLTPRRLGGGPGLGNLRVAHLACNSAWNARR